MGEFGQFLRRLREEQGQSLESVTQATRVPYRHLLALEAEQFQALPSDASARGFLRLLARHYRTDAQELLRQYERAVAPHGGGLQPLPLAKTNATIFKVQSGRRHAGLGMGVGLIVVILLIFGWMRSMQEPIPPVTVPHVAAKAEKGPAAHPTPPQQAAAQTKPSSPAEEQKAIASAVPPGPQAKSEPAVSPTAPAQADTPSKSVVASAPPAQPDTTPKTVDAASLPPPLKLEIEAHEPSWVQAALDGGEVKEALLQAGERITWTATEQIELTLGNAGGLAISFNGQSLTALGQPGQVVRMHLTKDGPDHVRRSLPPKSPQSPQLPSPSPSPLSTPQPPAPSTFAF